MPRPIRRVVTGHTPDGQATIIMDGPAPLVTQGADPEGGSTVVWITDRAPASNAGSADAAPWRDERVPTPPQSRGGTLLRVVDFLPRDRATPAAPLGVNKTPERSARHPGFHQTHTVDYAIVLEGEIWAVLDDTETLLRAGDILIQRGTYHAWDNRGDAVCRIAFVLIDAEPLPQA